MHPFARGLTIYFPYDESLYKTDYPKASSFASETGWNELLLSYIGAERTFKIAPSIKIDGVSPQSSNISSPARIIGNATGNNIAYLSRSIGRLENDGYVILNEHELYRYYINNTGKRRLPEFVNGRNNIDFTWAPTIDELTNGQESVIAPAIPTRQQEYYYVIVGKYERKNESQPFSAVLYFDYRTGKMISARELRQTLTNEVKETNEFEPKVGDVFTPKTYYYDLNKKEKEAIYLDGITFGNCGIWIEPRILTKGQYAIGLNVEDLSGNGNWAWKTVNISGQPISHPAISIQDLLGKWVGYGPYENTEFVFYFSENELSENDKKQLRSIFDLGFPSCNIWRWGETKINTVGKTEKKALSAYRLWNEDGLTFLAIILFPENETEPVYMTFSVYLQENKIHMRDIYQSGEYLLSKDGVSPETSR
jgi:hypothetical protein